MLRRVDLRFGGITLSRFSTVFILIFLSLVATARAQPEPSRGETVVPARTPGGYDGYRIGIGDVLLVRVFNHPELSRESAVDSRGQIRLPFLEEIQASCLTESELATAVRDKLRKYLREPQVDIMVKDYRSQPVAVIGAVAQPGRFQLQRRVRLLELLTFAGGPAQNAGSTLFVIHNNERQGCAPPQSEANSEASVAAAETESTAPILTTLKLRDLLVGAAEANRYVEPGDIVSVPEADQAFVTGSVVTPKGIHLNRPITLLEAISMAGGFAPDASMKNVRLIRQDGSGRNELVINIDDIVKRKAEDITLQANDVITVPSSTMKSIKRSLLNVIPGSVATLPLILIP